MIELVMARTDILDAETFERVRAGVPVERQRRSDGYHQMEDRYASVIAFALLQYQWRTRMHQAMPEVVVGIHGKPRFEASEWHFNWSHSAAVCVCALAAVPIGVDVQARVPFDDALFDRMAAPSEDRLRDRLRAADDLSVLWTRKEAVVKRTGRGLSTPLRLVDTVTPDVLTLSDDDWDLRLSVSAEGLSEDDVWSRLHLRCLRPGPTTAWSEVQRPRVFRRVDLRPGSPMES